MSVWSGDLDELPDRQAIVKLEKEFPGWQCFRGANLMTYGRTHDSPNELVRGEDWTDLRDEIRRAIARSERERWASSPAPGEPDRAAGPEAGE
jgi:hypothetical protein